MAEAKPFPLPDVDGPLAPLWQAASQGEFRLPRCQPCGTFDWYPTGECRACHGSDIEWVALSGRGTLFSWAVVKRALHKPLAPIAPYVSAIVVIDEDRKTRFVTRLVDCDPESLHAGMPVEVFFADLGYPAVETGVAAPLFTCRATIERDET
ncbi:MAG: OB-fold domain-containing protein [Novosphingobium sp.]|nr:OB-fold domain-containing protein [Novosphingobium sp.]